MLERVRVIVRSRCNALLLFAVTSLASAGAIAAPPPTLVVTQVSITDLGTLGGQQSAATDINENGSIVGWSDTSQGVQHAFLYSNGLMQDISGPLGSLPSKANAINDSGVIAGTAEAGGIKQAFQYHAGSIGALFPNPQAGSPQIGSDALGINNWGKIVGLCIKYSTPQLARGAFLSTPAPCTPLETEASPYWSTANDINDLNAIVGYTVGYQRMRRWQWGVPGQVTPGVHVPVPPGYSQSGGEAYGINNRGEVVGFVIKANEPSVHRAYFWDGVAALSVDLGSFPGGKNSEAQDVNEGHFVVGFADASASIPPPLFNPFWVSAFLYNAELGGMYALPVLPGMSTQLPCRAYRLNELGRVTKSIQIVGYCEANGVKRAVRWDVKVVPVT